MSQLLTIKEIYEREEPFNETTRKHWEWNNEDHYSLVETKYFKFDREEISEQEFKRLKALQNSLPYYFGLNTCDIEYYVQSSKDLGLPNSIPTPIASWTYEPKKSRVAVYFEWTARFYMKDAQFIIGSLNIKSLYKEADCYGTETSYANYIQKQAQESVDWFNNLSFTEQAKKIRSEVYDTPAIDFLRIYNRELWKNSLHELI